MDTRRLIFFLTLVLFVGLVHLNVSPSAFAATPSPSPDFQDPPPKEEPPSPEQTMQLEAMDISKPPVRRVQPEEREEFFFPYRYSIAIRLAPVFDTATTVDGRNVIYLAGVQYLFPLQDLKAFEAGADLLSDSSGAIHLSRRYIFSRSRFRPYTKAGFGLRVVPADQMVALLKYQNYQLRGAIGFEHLFRLPMSFRSELEVTAGMRSFQAILSLGYVWAW